MQPREKVRFFHDLSELIKSGITFPRAVETLSKYTRGKSRAALAQIGVSLTQGNTAADSLKAAPDAFGDLECGILTASERAGRLDQGLRQLAEYWEVIAAARSRIWRKLAYPLFLLHFALIAFSLQALLMHGVSGFLKQALKNIVILWIGIGAVIFTACLLLKIARRNAAVDSILKKIPLTGKMRSAFALSRFLTAYHLQLDAGVNVLASVQTAGRASSSAQIDQACAKALPDLRAGESVGNALMQAHVFPEPVMRAFAVGEQTGRVDEQLGRLAQDYQSKAIRRLDTLSEWIPKLIYIAVVIYAAWVVISFYVNYLNTINNLMK
jgi:general secretion pathway protein F